MEQSTNKLRRGEYIFAPHFDGTRFSSTHAYKAEGGRSLFGCEMHVKNEMGVQEFPTLNKKGPHNKRSSFQLLLLQATFLLSQGNYLRTSWDIFCSPTSQTTPPTCCLISCETEGVVYHQYPQDCKKYPREYANNFSGTTKKQPTDILDNRWHLTIFQPT